jgi:hypothetical protein
MVTQEQVDEITNVLNGQETASQGKSNAQRLGRAHKIPVASSVNGGTIDVVDTTATANAPVTPQQQSSNKPKIVTTRASDNVFPGITNPTQRSELVTTVEQRPNNATVTTVQGSDSNSQKTITYTDRGGRVRERYIETPEGKYTYSQTHIKGGTSGFGGKLNGSSRIAPPEQKTDADLINPSSNAPLLFGYEAVGSSVGGGYVYQGIGQKDIHNLEPIQTGSNITSYQERNYIISARPDLLSNYKPKNFAEAFIKQVNTVVKSRELNTAETFTLQASEKIYDYTVPIGKGITQQIFNSKGFSNINIASTQELKSAESFEILSGAYFVAPIPTAGYMIISGVEQIKSDVVTKNYGGAAIDVVGTIAVGKAGYEEILDFSKPKIKGKTDFIGGTYTVSKKGEKGVNTQKNIVRTFDTNIPEKQLIKLYLQNSLSEVALAYRTRGTIKQFGVTTAFEKITLENKKLSPYDITGSKLVNPEDMPKPLTYAELVGKTRATTTVTEVGRLGKTTGYETLVTGRRVGGKNFVNVFNEKVSYNLPFASKTGTLKTSGLYDNDLINFVNAKAKQKGILSPFESMSVVDEIINTRNIPRSRLSQVDASIFQKREGGTLNVRADITQLNEFDYSVNIATRYSRYGKTISENIVGLPQRVEQSDIQILTTYVPDELPPKVLSVNEQFGVSKTVSAQESQANELIKGDSFFGDITSKVNENLPKVSISKKVPKSSIQIGTESDPYVVTKTLSGNVPSRTNIELFSDYQKSTITAKTIYEERTVAQTPPKFSGDFLTEDISVVKLTSGVIDERSFKSFDREFNSEILEVQRENSPTNELNNNIKSGKPFNKIEAKRNEASLLDDLQTKQNAYFEKRLQSNVMTSKKLQFQGLTQIQTPSVASFDSGLVQVGRFGSNVLTSARPSLAQYTPVLTSLRQITTQSKLIQQPALQSQLRVQSQLRTQQSTQLQTRLQTQLNLKSQNQLQNQLQTQLQTRLQTQLQTRLQTQLRTSLYAQKFLQTKEPPKPPLLSRKKKKDEFLQGFDVFEKRFGKFQQLDKTPVTKAAAYNLGIEATRNTAGVTFYVKEAGQFIKQQPTQQKSFDISSLNKEYYTKQQGGNTLYLQKNKYRIRTSGEKSQITAQGLAAQRVKARGFF